jgi:hypothetical protein
MRTEAPLRLSRGRRGMVPHRVLRKSLSCAHVQQVSNTRPAGGSDRKLARFAREFPFDYSVISNSKDYERGGGVGRGLGVGVDLGAGVLVGVAVAVAVAVAVGVELAIAVAVAVGVDVGVDVGVGVGLPQVVGM